MTTDTDPMNGFDADRHAQKQQYGPCHDYDCDGHYIRVRTVHGAQVLECTSPDCDIKTTSPLSGN